MHNRHVEKTVYDKVNSHSKNLLSRTYWSPNPHSNCRQNCTKSSNYGQRSWLYNEMKRTMKQLYMYPACTGKTQWSSQN